MERVLWVTEHVRSGFRSLLSLDHASWSGRPVKVHSNQIETLIENNQCSTMWEVAGILKISKSALAGVAQQNWVPACESRGHQFDSQSGHVPRLQARSQVGDTWEATTHWCFTPSFSFPSGLSKIKYVLENQDGGVGRHTAPPRTTRTDRK